MDTRRAGTQSTGNTFSANAVTAGGGGVDDCAHGLACPGSGGPDGRAGNGGPGGAGKPNGGNGVAGGSGSPGATGVQGSSGAAGTALYPDHK